MSTSLILTIDLEDWFHLLEVDSLSSEDRWESIESRVERVTHGLLSILAKQNVKATFFVLGWIAQQYPGLVQEIVSAGHEIGSHSFAHPLVYTLTPKQFEYDLYKSIDAISNVTGKAVEMYRAPGFSITDECNWALEILAKYGIKIDCSIFPASRAHGGYRTSDVSGPTRLLLPNDVEIIELPMTIGRLFNYKVPYTGGGYFRFFPYPFFKHFSKQNDYLMTYFHPRDFDPKQPRLKELPLLKYYKTYVGLSTSLAKFERMLRDFKCVTVGDYLKNITLTKAIEVEVRRYE